MKILGWIVWALNAMFCIHFAFGVLHHVEKGNERTKAYGLMAFLLLNQSIWSLIFPAFNKLHLLWFYPLFLILSAMLRPQWTFRHVRRSGLAIPPFIPCLIVQFVLLYLLMPKK
jgi:hypothetical protein